MPPLRCLVLWPDSKTVPIVERMLSHMEIEAQVCTSARAALGKLRELKFDGVIVDGNDPQGAERLLQAVREAPLNRGATMFALSRPDQSKHVAFHWGAELVLEKPDSVKGLRETLRVIKDLMLTERRRYERYPVDAMVCMSNRDSLPGPTLATICNLSEGGMAIRASQPLRLGTVVLAQFELPEISGHLEARGRVVWSDSQGNAGIRFLQMVYSFRRKLERWCQYQESSRQAADKRRQKDRSAVGSF